MTLLRSWLRLSFGFGACFGQNSRGRRSKGALGALGAHSSCTSVRVERVISTSLENAPLALPLTHRHPTCQLPEREGTRAESSSRASSTATSRSTLCQAGRTYVNDAVSPAVRVQPAKTKLRPSHPRHKQNAPSRAYDDGGRVAT